MMFFSLLKFQHVMLYLKELPNLIECSIVLALIYVWNAKIADIFELLFYSHTCIKRSSLGQRKGGLLRQVTS